MNNAPNVKCPVHGEHGCLSNGKCWYCVQAGQVSVAPKITRRIGATGKTTRRIG